MKFGSGPAAAILGTLAAATSTNRVGARGRMKASKVLATSAIWKSRLQDFRTTVPGLHWAGLPVL